jgi:2-hydroxychromene-2-carboxylate isomerase
MLPQRHIARQRYRAVELQRWREVRGIALNLWPAFWPFDVTIPDRMLCAAVHAGADVGRLAQACWEATWIHERNLADATTLSAVATEAGFDGPALVKAAGESAAEQLYEANRTAAIAADVFGSPGYVLDGEVFWGQDRLDLLERALASGRSAYAPVMKS